MRLTEAEVKSYAARLTLLKYFPADPIARAMVVDFMAKLTGQKDRLEWLIAALVNHVGEWPGPKEVRGILCSRYKPADGVEAECSVPGFTAGEIEGGNACAALPLGSSPPQLYGGGRSLLELSKPVDKTRKSQLLSAADLREKMKQLLDPTALSQEENAHHEGDKFRQ